MEWSKAGGRPQLARRLADASHTRIYQGSRPTRLVTPAAHKLHTTPPLTWRVLRRAAVGWAPADNAHLAVVGRAAAVHNQGPAGIAAAEAVAFVRVVLCGWQGSAGRSQLSHAPATMHRRTGCHPGQVVSKQGDGTALGCLRLYTWLCPCRCCPQQTISPLPAGSPAVGTLCSQGSLPAHIIVLVAQLLVEVPSLQGTLPHWPAHVDSGSTDMSSCAAARGERSRLQWLSGSKMGHAPEQLPSWVAWTRPAAWQGNQHSMPSSAPLTGSTAWRGCALGGHNQSGLAGRQHRQRLQAGPVVSAGHQT